MQWRCPLFGASVKRGTDPREPSALKSWGMDPKSSTPTLTLQGLGIQRSRGKAARASRSVRSTSPGSGVCSCPASAEESVDQAQDQGGGSLQPCGGPPLALSLDSSGCRGCVSLSLVMEWLRPPTLLRRMPNSFMRESSQGVLGLHSAPASCPFSPDAQRVLLEVDPEPSDSAASHCRHSTICTLCKPMMMD